MRLPRPPDRGPQERAYARSIQRIALLPLIDVARHVVLPDLGALGEAARADGVRLDQDDGQRIRQLIREAQRRARKTVTQRQLTSAAFRAFARAEEQQARHLERVIGHAVTGERNSRKARENGRRVAILMTDPFGSEPWLEQEQRRAVRENVRLIKTIPGSYFDRLEADLFDWTRQGLRAEEIQARIQARYLSESDPSGAVGVIKRRAKLIAVDQVQKFHGRLDEKRQRDLGVTEYVWRTSRDERVRGKPGGKYPHARPSHHARDGKRFKWAKPPRESKDDGHPGQPVRCRCVSDPVLSGLGRGASAGRKKKAPPRRRRRAAPRIITPPAVPARHTPPAPRPPSPDEAAMAWARTTYGSPPPSRHYSVTPEADGLPAPAPRRAFDRERFRRDLDSALKALSSGRAPDAAERMLRVRRGLNELLANYELYSADVWRLGGGALSGKSPRHALGVHSFAGDIGLSADVRRRLKSWIAGRRVPLKTRAWIPTTPAKALEIDHAILAARTLVHESLHGHSPITPSAYRGVGRVLEEVTTESAARRVLVDKFGADSLEVNAHSFYNTWIDEVTQAVRDVGGLQAKEGWRRVQDASLALKRRREQIDSASGLARAFAEEVFPGNSTQAARLRVRLEERYGA